MPMVRAASLLLLAGVGVDAAVVCDGEGGITHGYIAWPGSDPTCSSSCGSCTPRQVVAAMTAAPNDANVQMNGCTAMVESSCD